MGVVVNNKVVALIIRMDLVSSISLLILGFHVYKDIWEPQIDDILICVRATQSICIAVNVAVTKGCGHKLGIKFRNLVLTRENSENYQLYSM